MPLISVFPAFIKKDGVSDEFKQVFETGTILFTFNRIQMFTLVS